MRILHVGKYYAPEKGGMETALREQVEGLLAMGHEVRVLVAGRARATEREPLGDETDALVRLGVAGNWASQPLTLSLGREWRRQLVDFRPRIVHLHTPNPLAAWAWRGVRAEAERIGCRLAVWHHSDIVRQRLGGRLVAPLVQRALADAAGICVSSELLRTTSQELARWRDKTTVIPFGIEAARFAAEPTGGGRFLFVGRLVPYKGLATLLDAVARVPAAELEIAGTGPMAAELAARRDRLGLTDRVHLLGAIDDDELPHRLQRCRALVLPSRDHSETFGLILLEAMAAARPVIASDLPTGVRELARPEQTGWLTTPGDPQSLADALGECLADPAGADARGRRGRQLVLSRYTRAQLAERLAGWYTSLVGS